MHTLLIFEPGHFHAALVLRQPHPRLADDIYVYATAGPDLDRFMQLAGSFNEREQSPTAWRLHLQTGKDPLERLIADRKGDIVVIAGRNDIKMKAIEQLSGAGFYVLADKPWLIDANALPLLEQALAPQRPLAFDIMTERFEITTLLQKAFMAEAGVFGEVRVDDDGSPSIFKESIHHLYKLVNDQPLVRPPWYFDINVQGEGITDVTTHLVDMTHWMLFPGEAINFNTDIELIDARRWVTEVPLDKFAKITTHKRFPQGLSSQVRNDILDYFSNGELIYKIKEIPVHIRVIWNLEIPPGGGDMHRSLIKGTRADLSIRQLPERGFKVELLIEPHEAPQSIAQAVQACLDRWADTYPGLALAWEGGKLRIDIPEVVRTGHEDHFCQVRDQYLDYLHQASHPPETRACDLAKYQLLVKARQLALDNPFKPLI
jgi:predicted dehydrogenase